MPRCNHKEKVSPLKTRALLLVIIGFFLITTKPHAIAQEVPPVLEFPEIGLEKQKKLLCELLQKPTEC